MTKTLPIATTEAVGVEEPNRNDPPWARGLKEFDDWGFIRCVATGRLVAIARAGLKSPLSEDHLNEHRRNKTDPYGDVAELIVRAVNAHTDLVKALEDIISAVTGTRETVNPENAFRAFGVANKQLMRAREIASAALSKAKGGE
jgi:hypothetical protein